MGITEDKDFVEAGDVQKNKVNPRLNLNDRVCLKGRSYQVRAVFT